MEHDLVGVVRGHPAVALAPVIADCVREDRAVTVERGARHWAWCRVECLEASTRILIPEVDCTVGAFRRTDNQRKQSK